MNIPYSIYTPRGERTNERMFFQIFLAYRFSQNWKKGLIFHRIFVSLTLNYTVSGLHLVPDDISVRHCFTARILYRTIINLKKQKKNKLSVAFRGSRPFS